MIFFAVTIDTECDKGPKWLIQKPLRFRSVLEGIPERLEPLFRRFGTHATYFLSPEVIQNDLCVSVLQKVQQGGAELGTHLHGEFIEPNSEMDTDETWKMQNMYPQQIEMEKLKNLTSLFRKKFGFSPVSFRAGRFGIGKHSLPILADLGYEVDSSVAPYCFWKDKGGEVSFMGAPINPYCPDQQDPLHTGNLSILEVPVTIGKTWWKYFPGPILKTVPRYSHMWGLLTRAFHRQFQPIWLRPTHFSFEDMKELIEMRGNSNSPDPILLVMMFHNVEVIPGCSPYAQTEEEVKIFLSRLEKVLQYLDKKGGKFITLLETRKIYGNR